MPVVILIWTLLTFTFHSKSAANLTQNKVRECAWKYALNGCKRSIPSWCTSHGEDRINDVPLRLLTSASFARIAMDVPVTIPAFLSLHGDVFSVSTKKEVERPAILGGKTTARGRFATACGKEAIPIPMEFVFQNVCRKFGVSSWCW